MQVVQMPINELTPYANNPRVNDTAVKFVAESIKEFGFKVPIVIDIDRVIAAGHTRYKAAQKLGLHKVPCIVAEDLTEEQVKAYRLADNKTAEVAEWDFDLLNTELESIVDIEMELFGFEEMVKEFEKEAGKPNSLQEGFIVPPFSVLDTRQGYWQDRKREWLSIGIDSEKGRDNALLGKGLQGLAKKKGTSLSGTSVFDPVLCEIIYKWFNVEQGKIYDCFAGGSVRGIVAEKLGYSYTGIDLRKEQIDANRENGARLGLSPEWYCDDSLNVDKYLPDDSVDLVFSCPPYADLEIYSDDPRDISNMEYDSFISVYQKIIELALKKLKNDRFAVFVVGDVRDKKGFYRDFISDTKKIFINLDCKLYNELILVDQIGSAVLRAGRIFSGGRKVVKTHQNVLVFYKGNPKNITKNYKEIEIENLEESNST